MRLCNVIREKRAQVKSGPLHISQKVRRIHSSNSFERRSKRVPVIKSVFTSDRLQFFMLTFTIQEFFLAIRNAVFIDKIIEVHFVMLIDEG